MINLMGNYFSFKLSHFVGKSEISFVKSTKSMINFCLGNRNESKKKTTNNVNVVNNNFYFFADFFLLNKEKV